MSIPSPQLGSSTLMVQIPMPKAFEEQTWLPVDLRRLGWSCQTRAGLASVPSGGETKSRARTHMLDSGCFEIMLEGL